MFTNQKIEASQWPWAYLMVSERPDQAAWIEQKYAIPIILPNGGVGSNVDVRGTFKDTYVDLNDEVEHLSELSLQADYNVAPSKLRYL